MKFKRLAFLLGLTSCSFMQKNLVSKIEDCPLLVDIFEDEKDSIYIAIPNREVYVKFSPVEDYLLSTSGNHIKTYSFWLCSEIKEEIEKELRPSN